MKEEDCIAEKESNELFFKICINGSVRQAILAIREKHGWTGENVWNFEGRVNE